MSEAQAIELLKNLNGIHLGLLDDEEIEALDLLCSKGKAKRLYEGACGFMGLAKVKLL